MRVRYMHNQSDDSSWGSRHGLVSSITELGHGPRSSIVELSISNGQGHASFATKLGHGSFGKEETRNKERES